MELMWASSRSSGFPLDSKRITFSEFMASRIQLNREGTRGPLGKKPAIEEQSLVGQALSTLRDSVLCGLHRPRTRDCDSHITGREQGVGA